MTYACTYLFMRVFILFMRLCMYHRVLYSILMHYVHAIHGRRMHLISTSKLVILATVSSPKSS